MWLLGGLGRALAVLAAAALVIFLLIRHGEQKAKQEQLIEQYILYGETQKVINEVRPSTTRAAAVDRLRTNGWVR
jgi:hypothetical protein